MSEEDLWSAVILRACEDLEWAPRGSPAYDEASAFFFTESGQWAQSRQAVADWVSLHVNDIERLGREALKRRDLREPRPHRAPATQSPDPVPIAAGLSPVPPVLPAPVRKRRVPPPRPVRDRNWWISNFLNKGKP